MAEKVIPRKRNGYYYINGNEYPSVTKILGVIDKPFLMYWASREHVRIALRHPELNEKEISSRHRSNVKKTTDRGRLVHDYIERYLHSGKKEDYPVALLPFMEAFFKWFELHKPEVIATEVEVYSDKYCFASRVDFICRINGVIWLIDWKTGKDYPRRETGLQLVSYKEGLKEKGVIDIERMGMVICTPDGTFSFKEFNAKFDSFLDVYKVWKWVNKKG